MTPPELSEWRLNMASLAIFILASLEVSFKLLESSIMLLENIYSTCITHDDRHVQLSYFYSTGHHRHLIKQTD
jgi:hypothetical protein